MRILLDEQMPKDLIAELAGHEVRTVGQMGWNGYENGQLLAAAANGFDVLISMDKNMPVENDISQYRVGLILVRAFSNRIDSLLVHNLPYDSVKDFAPVASVEKSEYVVVVIDKLSAEIARIVAMPDTTETLAKLGMEPLIATPEQFSALMQAALAKSAEVIKSANIKLD